MAERVRRYATSRNSQIMTRKYDMSYRKLKTELRYVKQNEELVAKLEAQEQARAEREAKSRALAARVGVLDPRLTSTGRLTQAERRRIDRLRAIPADRVCPVCRAVVTNVSAWAVKPSGAMCMTCSKSRNTVLDADKIETILTSVLSDDDVALVVGVSPRTVRRVRKRYGR